MVISMASSWPWINVLVCVYTIYADVDVNSEC